jgi:integrase
MSRTIRDAQLETRTARHRLAARADPYWRTLTPGQMHLGYRRSKKDQPGRWMLRAYIGGSVGSPYEKRVIGLADDFADADGRTILSYTQAHDLCVALREAKSVPASLATVTVKDAIAARMMAHQHSRPAQSRMKRYILSDAIAAVDLAKLAEKDLKEWSQRLPSDLEIGSKRRIRTDFKAALNEAFRLHRKTLPADLPTTIRHGLAESQRQSPAARDKQILSDADVRRLIIAASEIDTEDNWAGDLYRVIIVLAATGARFSQAARLRVVDVQVEAERLIIPVTSKGGRGEKQRTETAMRVGTDVIAALLPALVGREGYQALLERWRWRQVTPTKWERERRAPWATASEMSRAWKLIVERAGLPEGTVPYAFRHSSIVRGLRAGLPTRLVAALHDTSVQMVEKHYSAFITDALDELAAKAIVPLTSAPVTHLRPVGGKE